MSEDRAISTEVVVVGAGSAGMNCAISLAEAGRPCIVAEIQGFVGGTLHLSGGHMSAAGTKRQQERGITDSIAGHLEDVRKIGRRGYVDGIQQRAVSEAPAFVDWLTANGFDFDPVTPAYYFGHEPYSKPRTHWGVSAGASILETLMPAWNRGVDGGLIQPYLGWALGEILRDEHGQIGGVAVASVETGEVLRIRAEQVVLATGGFGSDAEIYREITGYGAELPRATLTSNAGSGLTAALDAGGALRRNRELLRLGRFPGVADPTRVDPNMRADLEALARPPREIWVNTSGRRFVDEADPVVTKQEYAVAEQPEQLFWVIADRVAVEAKESVIRGWRQEDYVRAADSSDPRVRSAGTLEELARLCDLPAERLRETVHKANQESGGARVAEVGRPAAVDTPPYFAIRCQGTVLVTFSGVSVDDDLTVLDERGDPIHGLYAVGEVVGAGATAGEAFTGGMVLTPALSLGRWLGSKLAKKTTS